MNYLKYLGFTTLAILVFSGLIVPILIPSILVFTYHYSAWWFLLCLLYIPVIAFFVYVCEEGD